MRTINSYSESEAEGLDGPLSLQERVEKELQQLSLTALSASSSPSSPGKPMPLYFYLYASRLHFSYCFNIYMHECMYIYVWSVVCVRETLTVFLFVYQ